MAVSAACLPAAAAEASSLVFIKQSNVWLSQPDGTGQYQVTLDGSSTSPYRSPSQADDGTIVALREGRLWRMKQNGELLNEPIPTAASGGGPLHPAVSPSGRLVALDYVSAIPRPGGSLVKETIYSYADRLTNRDEIRPAGGFFDPSWIDETRTVLFAGSSVWTDPVGPAEPVEWFNDGDYYGDVDALPQDLADGDVAGDKVALVWGDEHQVLGIYHRTDASFTSDPVQMCSFQEATGGEFSEPTLAPDGSAVAWQEGDGVWAAPLPADGCTPDGAQRLIIAGATEPDFGPAAVNPGPRTRPEPPKPCCAPPVADTTPPVVNVGLARVRIVSLLRGLRVPFTCSEACRATAALTLDRRVAKRIGVPRALGQASSEAASTAGTIVVRVPRTAKRKLRHQRRLRMTLRVTATDAAGNAATVQRQLTARR